MGNFLWLWTVPEYVAQYRWTHDFSACRVIDETNATVHLFKRVWPYRGDKWRQKQPADFQPRADAVAKHLLDVVIETIDSCNSNTPDMMTAAAALVQSQTIRLCTVVRLYISIPRNCSRAQTSHSHKIFGFFSPVILGSIQLKSPRSFHSIHVCAFHSIK